ncbi:MAG TPA: Sec-dependent nitrous-oxide reductase [Pseudonocardiaceae bacterium]
MGGAALLAGCTSNESGSTSLSNMPQDALGVAKARGLSSDDVLAAMKTYMPTGKLDTHYMVASGGHSGQIWVIGIPSMRILKVIPVFTHSSYQGWGFTDESKEVLAGGAVDGKVLTFGDTHHPGLSETNGEYDGQFLFINEKTNGRIAVIDLRDFQTKQILKNPLIISDHGGTFVTPNTEYVIESSQYAAPLGWTYSPMTQDSFNNTYRGAARFWKFDRTKGRIDPAKSFSIELPPYFQDLADAGKLASDGWAFINSFNTERAIVGTGTPEEKGASANDMDYLHVINWKAAEAAVAAGKAKTVNGTPLITMDVATQEGILYLIPEPKSPHGVDVTPKGDYIVVSGKLDPHVTIYSFQKIQDAIKAGKFTKDPYGLPIIDFKSVVEAQVQVGLGPLHTQFDQNGFAYTSLFLESAVCRWTLGGSYRQDGWKVSSKIPINYNVGHVSVVGGDTVKPEGNYLVALNKWSLDRFAGTGPHHTVNLQLVDISQQNKMQLLADLPIPDGEPHYAQIIPASKLKPLQVYPVGTNAQTMSPDPKATAAGKEHVDRNGTTVEVYSTAMRSHFTPDLVEVNQGDTVIWHITNIEQAVNASHGFVVPGYDVSIVLDPGQVLHVTMTADKAGTFPFYCTEFCSALHLEMMGYFLVKPAA